MLFKCILNIFSQSSHNATFPPLDITRLGHGRPVSLKAKVFAGGLITMSGCIFIIFYFSPDIYDKKNIIRIHHIRSIL